jgi:hypothetical protein
MVNTLVADERDVWLREVDVKILSYDGRKGAVLQPRFLQRVICYNTFCIIFVYLRKRPQN